MVVLRVVILRMVLVGVVKGKGKGCCKRGPYFLHLIWGPVWQKIFFTSQSSAQSHRMSRGCSKNAQVLAETLVAGGLQLASGGTDSQLGIVYPCGEPFPRRRARGSATRTREKAAQVP